MLYMRTEKGYKPKDAIMKEFERYIRFRQLHKMQGKPAIEEILEFWKEYNKRRIKRHTGVEYRRWLMNNYPQNFLKIKTITRKNYNCICELFSSNNLGEYLNHCKYECFLHQSMRKKKREKAKNTPNRYIKKAKKDGVKTVNQDTEKILRKPITKIKKRGKKKADEGQSKLFQAYN